MDRATSSNMAVAVTDTTAEFSGPMVSRGSYCIVSTVPAWVRIGTTGCTAAVLGTGSFYLPANTYLPIVADSQTKGCVNIIRAELTNGAASLIQTEID